eukprot:sb/3477112/
MKTRKRVFTPLCHSRTWAKQSPTLFITFYGCWFMIVRAYYVNFMVIFGIIVIKLILLLGGPIESLEAPEKMEGSRDKTKGTKMISVLELVGVGAGIIRFWSCGYNHLGMV